MFSRFFVEKLILLIIGSYLTLYITKHLMDLNNLENQESIINESIVENCNSFPSFKSIIGHKDQKTLIKSLIKKINNNENVSNGLILYGPPGTGKTLFAKCIAKEFKGNFINVCPSIIESKYVGESNKMVSALFSLASKKKPCVLFFDEIDGIGSSRSILDQSHNNTLKTVLLSKLDGLNSDNKGIFFIGATNRLDSIDPAIKRRLRLFVKIDFPSENDIKELLNIHLNDDFKDNIDTIVSTCIEKKCSQSDVIQLCKFIHLHDNDLNLDTFFES